MTRDVKNETILLVDSSTAMPDEALEEAIEIPGDDPFFAEVQALVTRERAWKWIAGIAAGAALGVIVTARRR